jgi:O-antigen/teichoic acid export membrane protein
MPTQKIYTNTIAQIWAKAITGIISIYMITVLTGYLDIAGYGLYTKIYNYLSIFAVIADLGLYTITVRELSKYQDDPVMVAKISGNVLALRTLSGICIIGLALAIAPFLSGYDTITAYISIAIVSLFTLAGLINSSIMSYLQATLRTEFSIVANTCGKLLTFGMIALFASILYPAISGISEGEKIVLVMLAWLAGNILMTALTWWYANRFQLIRFAWDTEYIRYIIRISLPYWLALFLNVIFFKVDIILLSVMEDRAIADIAIALYAVPMKIVEVGMMSGTIFLNSLLPVLTTAFEKNDTKAVQKLTSHTLTLLGVVWLGISVFFYSLAPWIISQISTNAYINTTVMGYSSVDALRIVAWIFLVYFVSSLYTYILIAQGRQKKMMYINAVIASINIVGNIIFIPLYSFVGSAWVTLVSQILLLGWTYIATRQK